MHTFSVLSLGGLVGLTALLAASYSDIRTREVPDWLNFGLTAFALGNAILLSLISRDLHILTTSLFGLAIGATIGLVMFYTGQWGGGDSKLVIGLSALIGFELGSWQSSFLLIFFVSTLFVGAIYGIGYSVIMAIVNLPRWRIAARDIMISRYAFFMRRSILVLLVGSTISALFLKSTESYMVLIFSVALTLVFYTWVLVTAVEKVCMLRRTPVSELTDGDWVMEIIKRNGRVLYEPSKTGITLNQIRMLANMKVRSVIVKVGIPFVPSFLLAYLATSIAQRWLG